MHRRGFTIIELVIVITIMAILMTMGVVNFRSSQANARDTQRKTDIESIAQHLETYYTSGTDNSVFNMCTGGTITHDGLYTVHTFTSSGTLTCTGGNITAEALVVGGGGSSPSGGWAVGSGGGGGGGYLDASQTLSGTMTVTVGSGGTINYNNAGSSSFGTLTALGGGEGGGCYGNNSSGNAGNGSTGGSGGGAAGSNVTAGTGTAGQGYAGGLGYGTYTVSSTGGGGGGGAGGPGGAAINTTSTPDGIGGPGIYNDIAQRGIKIMYGAGGNGVGDTDTYGYGGAPNTGMGAVGGGGDGSTITYTGGAGGSGIVIVRYLTPTTSDTYPSTALTNTTVPAEIFVTNLSAMLRDIDLDSVTAPGMTDPVTPSQTFISATCSVTCIQTTAGVTPQPTINQYVYQPLHRDGTLCTDNQECSKFNLYYRTEVDNNVNMVSSVDQ